MRLVGLTGGIATGKSTVSALLAAQGLPVIDADKIAKAIVQKGRRGYRRVVKAFGTEILQADGEIDRKKLGELVFKDPVLRKRLNAATHPLVTLELAAQIIWHWLMFHFVVIVDVPLLFEGGLDKYADMCITVACDPQRQRQRLMQRDQSEQAAADARIAAQMPLSEKIKRSKIVVDNSGTPDELIEKVEALGKVLRQDNGFRGLISSPLAVLFALLAFFPVVNKYAASSWHRFTQSRLLRPA